ncbi:MAG: hypothetical protein K0M47_11965, partial [Rhizobium sp.]|nr:hypothetical protein [Rhizobium sp.]
MSQRAFLTLLLVAALAGCSAETAEAPKETVRPVKVVAVAEASTTRELSYSGAVRARSEAPAGFRGGGKVVERAVNLALPGRAGEGLARLYATDYELSVTSARANLVAANGRWRLRTSPGNGPSNCSSSRWQPRPSSNR